MRTVGIHIVTAMFCYFDVTIIIHTFARGYGKGQPDMVLLDYLMVWRDLVDVIGGWIFRVFAWCRGKSTPWQLVAKHTLCMTS